MIQEPLLAQGWVDRITFPHSARSLVLDNIGCQHKDIANDVRS